MSRSMNRRMFLVGAGAAAGSTVVTACGGGNGGVDDQTTTTASASSAAPTRASGSASGTSSAAAPTRVPYTAVAADLPAGEHGIPAGYFHYPANPKPFIAHPTGSGGTVSFMCQADVVMTPKDKNSWWQGIDKAVDADLDVQTVSSYDYPQKFQVAVAGSELADVVQFHTIQNTPELLATKFADLTDFLGGDNIKAYPGLASFPTATWQVSTVNGRVWGIGKPVLPAGQIASTRGDLLKGFGVASSPEIGTGDDFLQLCQQLTDVKRGKYAIGEQPNTWVLNAVLEMMGAPNGWQEEGGKFTSVNEVAQMKDALEQVAKMWSAGYIHPDSFATPGKNFTWWSGGTTSIYFQNNSGWARYANLYPTWDIGVIRAPKWGGGGPADKILGVAGYGDFAALKKADPKRIDEILRILDFIAAPFGTSEYLTMNYGAAGVDYQLRGSDPVPTAAAKNDYPQGLAYCGGQQNINLYIPGNDAVVKAVHGFLSAVLPTGIANPSWGLYSETAVAQGATANKNLSDAQSDVIQGRKKVSDWDGVVKTWRQQAGDKIRQDYEKAFAASH